MVNSSKMQEGKSNGPIEIVDQRQEHNCGYWRHVYQPYQLAQNFTPTLSILTRIQIRFGYKGIIDGIDPTSLERMKWFDALSAGKQHTDFFANRVTNYSKGHMEWNANDIF